MIRIVLVSVHQDTLIIILVHTTGTSLEGPERTRQCHKFKDGNVVQRKWTLQQPHVHALYRKDFSAVIFFNKLALGLYSIATIY